MKENRFTQVLCYEEYITPHLEVMNAEGWHIVSISYISPAEKWVQMFWEREKADGT